MVPFIVKIHEIPFLDLLWSHFTPGYQQGLGEPKALHSTLGQPQPESPNSLSGPAPDIPRGSRAAGLISINRGLCPVSLEFDILAVHPVCMTPEVTSVNQQPGR